MVVRARVQPDPTAPAPPSTLPSRAHSQQAHAALFPTNCDVKDLRVARHRMIVKVYWAPQPRVGAELETNSTLVDRSSGSRMKPPSSQALNARRRSASRRMRMSGPSFCATPRDHRAHVQPGTARSPPKMSPVRFDIGVHANELLRTTFVSP